LRTIRLLSAKHPLSFYIPLAVRPLSAGASLRFGIHVVCLVTMQPERRQALKAEPLRGGADAPALTACRRPGWRAQF